ncbi:hypothetical protein ACQCP0_13015 [Ralstonia pseudosolanacearum]|uniref:Uncharacterized protein n=3 Tax=Ralstonia solanacearum species complex TaxID=3116862 RepID=A0A454TP34_9RALS|nr:hypothetical protein [Ralstonia pseudosolanacearum]AUS42882.1 hypothetical protein CYD94_12285 [Ralstonia solanacearum]AST85958.1 hypothetical protein CIG66_05550 [Ralstonia pseudosolanacearum]AYA46050.1 hypothetical protein RSP824_05870 [Ralstonia pseudosolanacearum]MCF1443164.1 hypothetical protein [Ralstonia solanacearum]MCK4129307.1 hypothetical protein [Ralstonia pseudosolanacearum]
MLETKAAQKWARMSRRAMVGLTAAVALLGGLGAGNASAQATRPKAPIYGVTLDDVSNINAIVASLTHLPYKPTVRVVFDPGTTAAQYYPALVKLHAVAYVMGEIMDSYYFPTDLATYQARTQELVGTLKNVVDVWEIANEINGEWLRANPSGPTATATSQEQAIGQMVGSAYDIVKGVGGLVSVTMYYNDDGKGTNCYELPMDSWRTWATNFLPARVRQGADYALFSYYPYQDCPGLSPTWTSDFKLLEQIFPVAKVGFGEIGTSSIYAPTSVQQSLIKTYYPIGTTQMASDPRFIGGYFWWNYVEQMLPYTTSTYWNLLKQTITPLPAPQ